MVMRKTDIVKVMEDYSMTLMTLILKKKKKTTYEGQKVQQHFFEAN